MSTTVISICNAALGRVSAHAITDINGASQEAKACKKIYESMRDIVLEERDWGFARRRQVLALRTDSFSGWTYAYAYPTDCLAARQIYNGSNDVSTTYYDPDTDSYQSTGEIEYELSVSDDRNEQIILTDESEAELIYTSRVTNPAIYSATFADALSQRMASELSLSLKDDLKAYATHLSVYSALMNVASTNDAKQGFRPPNRANSFVDARR